MMAWRTMRPGTSDAIDRSTADPSPPSPPSLSRCTAKKLAPTNIKNTLWGNPRNPPKSMCHASRSQCRLSRGGGVLCPHLQTKHVVASCGIGSPAQYAWKIMTQSDGFYFVQYMQ